jgi:hypothetical protein
LAWELIFTFSKNESLVAECGRCFRVKAPFIPSSLGCSLLVVLFSSHCLIGIFSFTLSVLLAGDLAKY